MRFAICVEPAFDDLVAIKIRANGVFQCSDQESRHFAFWCVTQVPAHRYTFGVPDLRGHPVVGVSGLEIEAAKETHDHPRASGGIGLAAFHGIEDRFARILLRPDGGITRRSLLPTHDGGLVSL